MIKIQNIGLILQIISIYYISEAIISLLFSEDQQTISKVGRSFRILFGVIILIISFYFILKH